ncbi:helix-turn-helix transcriptional regulator [Nonomuraea sp. B19D2]|uniref:helix-turn-helix domain-containing protein n=1 Tax=Nonomuraea sp. B19D2 TaxID=3159561 RepID=UPI0032D9FE4C
MSNRDIAAQLFLGHRTVEYHLYKAYPKLGIRSRHELAALELGPVVGQQSFRDPGEVHRDRQPRCPPNEPGRSVPQGPPRSGLTASEEPTGVGSMGISGRALRSRTSPGL